MGLEQYKNKKCYEEKECKHGRIVLKTCVGDTQKTCCLSKGEEATQLTELNNRRAHICPVKIEIQSLNGNIAIFDGNDYRQKYKKEVQVPPRKGHEMEFQIKRKCHSQASTGTVTIATTIHPEDSVVNNREGPVVHSQVRFI